MYVVKVALRLTISAAALPKARRRYHGPLWSCVIRRLWAPGHGPKKFFAELPFAILRIGECQHYTREYSWILEGVNETNPAFAATF